MTRYKQIYRNQKWLYIHANGNQCKDISEQAPFILTKKSKITEINLRNVQYLHEDIFEILQRGQKKDVTNWEDITYSWVKRYVGSS